MTDTLLNRSTAGLFLMIVSVWRLGLEAPYPRIRYMPLSAVMLRKALIGKQLFVPLLSALFRYWSIISIGFFDQHVPILSP